jgi:hypothetical protein
VIERNPGFSPYIFIAPHYSRAAKLALGGAFCMRATKALWLAHVDFFHALRIAGQAHLVAAEFGKACETSASFLDEFGRRRGRDTNIPDTRRLVVRSRHNAFAIRAERG